MIYLHCSTSPYLQRVPRWWARKGPAARPQISRPAVDRCEAVLLATPIFNQAGDSRMSARMLCSKRTARLQCRHHDGLCPVGHLR
ncbi:hypothetical protein E1J23_20585 [Xanthomonas gardneri]|nr:hypothetical protein [Xanthomonas hortorum pv. gardneri]